VKYYVTLSAIPKHYKCFCFSFFFIRREY